MARNTASGRFSGMRPGINAGATGKTFKASQGKKAPRGRTSSGAPRAMPKLEPPKNK